MKLQLLSDLHLESNPGFAPEPAPDADLLVLAGDIGSYQSGSALTALDDHDFGLGRFSPLLARAERLLRPRLLFVTSIAGERVIGGLCLVLALVLALPIPLGNMLPAIAISLMALGVLERDGVWVIGGAVIGALSLVVVWGVVWALARAAFFVIINAF